MGEGGRRGDATGRGLPPLAEIVFRQKNTSRYPVPSVRTAEFSNHQSAHLVALADCPQPIRAMNRNYAP